MRSEKTNETNPGNTKKGALYLIPTPLGPHPENHVLPEQVIQTVHHLDTFFVERIRKANSFLRWISHPLPDYKCRFYELNKHTPGEDLVEMLSLLKNGIRAGILTEAGCPAVADPGSNLVRLAHEANIPVIPLVGPSSILLALMASGLNGQTFAFHGYLPRPGRERTESIRNLQNESARKNITQIFMETPYRNSRLLEELVRELPDDTLLSVASNLTLPDERILTRNISAWKKLWKTRPGNVNSDKQPDKDSRPVSNTENTAIADLDRRPAVFLMLASFDRKKKPAHKRKRADKQSFF